MIENDNGIVKRPTHIRSKNTVIAVGEGGRKWSEVKRSEVGGEAVGTS